MKTYLTKLFIIVSLFAMAIPASAAIACAGKVTNAYTDSTGTFTISATYRADYTALCNVRVLYLGVDPVTCRTWVATVMTAMSKGYYVQVYYSDPAATACASLPVYGASLPLYYVMMLNN